MAVAVAEVTQSSFSSPEVNASLRELLSADKMITFNHQDSDYKVAFGRVMLGRITFVFRITKDSIYATDAREGRLRIRGNGIGFEVFLREEHTEKDKLLMTIPIVVIDDGIYVADKNNPDIPYVQSQRRGGAKTIRFYFGVPSKNRFTVFDYDSALEESVPNFEDTNPTKQYVIQAREIKNGEYGSVTHTAQVFWQNKVSFFDPREDSPISDYVYQRSGRHLLFRKFGGHLGRKCDISLMEADGNPSSRWTINLADNDDMNIYEEEFVDGQVVTATYYSPLNDQGKIVSLSHFKTSIPFARILPCLGKCSRHDHGQKKKPELIALKNLSEEELVWIAASRRWHLPKITTFLRKQGYAAGTPGKYLSFCSFLKAYGFTNARSLFEQELRRQCEASGNKGAANYFGVSTGLIDLIKIWLRDDDPFSWSPAKEPQSVVDIDEQEFLSCLAEWNQIHRKQFDGSPSLLDFLRDQMGYASRLKLYGGLCLLGLITPLRDFVLNLCAEHDYDRKTIVRNIGVYPGELVHWLKFLKSYGSVVNDDLTEAKDMTLKPLSEEEFLQLIARWKSARNACMDQTSKPSLLNFLLPILQREYQQAGTRVVFRFLRAQGLLPALREIVLDLLKENNYYLIRVADIIGHDAQSLRNWLQWLNIPIETNQSDGCLGYYRLGPTLSTKQLEDYNVSWQSHYRQTGLTLVQYLLNVLSEEYSIPDKNYLFRFLRAQGLLPVLKEIVYKLLIEHGYNITSLSYEIGIYRKTLHKWLTKLEVPADEKKKHDEEWKYKPKSLRRIGQTLSAEQLEEHYALWQSNYKQTGFTLAQYLLNALSKEYSISDHKHLLWFFGTQELLPTLREIVYKMLIGHGYNYSSLSSEIGITHATLRSWLKKLEISATDEKKEYIAEKRRYAREQRKHTSDEKKRYNEEKRRYVRERKRYASAPVPTALKLAEERRRKIIVDVEEEIVLAHAAKAGDKKAYDKLAESCLESVYTAAKTIYYYGWRKTPFYTAKPLLEDLIAIGHDIVLEELPNWYQYAGGITLQEYMPSVLRKRIASHFFGETELASKERTDLNAKQTFGKSQYSGSDDAGEKIDYIADPSTLKGGRRSPEQTIISQADNARLIKALSGIGQNARYVVYQYFYEELSPEEISEKIEGRLSPDQVNTLLEQSLPRLRGLLTEETEP